jgi:aspartate beta-hydroxylase
LSDVNATAVDASVDQSTVMRLLNASKAAMAAGRGVEADQLLARAGQLAPAHPAVLNELGVRMLRQGDAAKARELFERATRADGSHPALWSNLASSLHLLNLFSEELQALERALALEPRHLPSLLQKGQLIEQSGDTRNAARSYRNALATIAPGAPLPETVRVAAEHARTVVASDDQTLAQEIESRMAPLREQHGAADFRRATRCVEMLTGRRSRYASEPTFMFFPQIPTVEFFDRAEFPWLDALEAATDDIRQELIQVMVSDREGLEPYIAYREGLPLDQWKELNNSRRWSAYFLWNQAKPQSAHIARCPRTAAVLEKLPLCDVPNHGPTAYFSILDARTRIPPHTGVTNTRAIVHLPLIVPPGCGFRVGSETREFSPATAWVFDDTIEHEAWNDSDTPRAILIIDTWNPFLSAAERDVVRAATEVVGTYYGETQRQQAL